MLSDAGRDNDALDEVSRVDWEDAVMLYRWRLQDYSGAPSYRRIIRKIRKYTEQARCAEWNELLCSVALIETHERGSLSRATEWAVHALTCGRAGLTLGPFQQKGAPWKLPRAIDIFIYRCRQRGVSPSLADENLGRFAKLWYGHDKIETGSALSYPSALKIAAKILEETTYPVTERR